MLATVAFKQLTKRMLLGGRITRMLGRFSPPGAVILMYHSVQPDPARFARTIGEGIIHTAAIFQRQMERLSREFHPVTLDQVQRFLSGDAPLPRRAVAVTFDDGFRDNYEIAAPILQRCGIPATFYITAGCIPSGKAPWFSRIRYLFHATPEPQWNDEGGRAWELCDAAARSQAALVAMQHCAKLTGDPQEAYLTRLEQNLACASSPACDGLMLTWQQIQALARAGHSIGSHSLTHPNLAHISPAEVRHELQQSKRLLEERLAVPVRHFSYPCAILYPHWNQQTETLCRESGYQTATICQQGVVRAGQRAMSLNRLPAPAHFDDFQWHIEATFWGRRV